MLKTKYLLLCASLLFTSTVFTACDDDDDSSSSTEKLLKSTTETDYEVNDGEIGAINTFIVESYVYDNKGRVIDFTVNDSDYNYKCVISYNGNHVKMIKTETNKGKTTTEIDTTGLLNEDGNIIRYTVENEAGDGVDTVSLFYENGFLISEKWKDSISTYTYENNCLKTSDNGTWTYYYTDETNTVPIVSKGDWEGYYLRGKCSAYLPVKEVETSEGNTYYLKWTLNADGYPVKCEKRMYDSSNKLSGYSVNTYTWQ
jgi:hypothetical protein